MLPPALLRPLALFDPDRYHGHGRRTRFFEGWYYKLVDAGRQARLAVIPGVFMSPDGARRYAFVMVFDSGTGRVHFVRYPMAEITAARDCFDLRIGPNRFTADGLVLDVRGEDLHLAGELAFSERAPWPITLRAPGIMGWYAYVPFMECFHGVVSLDHRIDGALRLNGTVVDFTDGRGYTEKDWGCNFPSAWVWTQANHFDAPGTSLTASVAIIPFLVTTFTGSIVGLRHNGRLYRFTTYTGARIEALDVSAERIRLVTATRRHRLSVTATRGPAGRLYAPLGPDMAPAVEESLTSEVTVRLAEAAAPHTVLYEGTSPVGALEVHGDLARLRSMLKLA